MLEINLHEAYDEHGNINKALSDSIEGYKQHVSLLPGVHVFDQHIRSKQNVQLSEQALRGFYFSLVGSKPIQSIDDIDDIQVSYQAKDISGHFTMSENDEHSLFQVLITAEQMAMLFHETEDQLITYFSELFQSLDLRNGVLTLPLTEKNKRIAQTLLDSRGQRLSLIGHIYAFVFSLVEQIKMLHHINRCENCQGKIFQAQNLLEIPDQSNIDIRSLASQVGLNEEALRIGFLYIVGQSIDAYCVKSRMQQAAAMLRQDPNAKPSIVAKSGFTEPQFEAAFLQHFGVSSQQYGQIH